MGRARIRGLDGRTVRKLLSQAKDLAEPGARVTRFGELLLGRPYDTHPLIGSAATPEVFTASLDAFDCVTYVEAALALARSSSAARFPEELRRIRYEDGDVAWSRRNHYMVDWMKANTRAGAVRDVAAGVALKRQERLLDAVPGLPPRRVRVASVPKRELGKLSPRLRSGDIICFASTKKRLDVFHCGILVEGGGGWRMRHASRAHGKVIEEDLDTFLKRHRMAGVMVVRPSLRGAEGAR
jgi:hypothetical protein